MSKKLDRAQAHIKGIDVARMILKFREEFKDVYPSQIFSSTPFSAVGPCHSFIGFCIQKGYLETKDE